MDAKELYEELDDVTQRLLCESVHLHDRVIALLDAVTSDPDGADVLRTWEMDHGYRRDPRRV